MALGVRLALLLASGVVSATPPAANKDSVLLRILPAERDPDDSSKVIPYGLEAGGVQHVLPQKLDAVIVPAALGNIVAVLAEGELNSSSPWRRVNW